MEYSPRQIAIIEGKTRYFTGLACPNGHVSERMVSTRACCECVSEKKRAWSEKNPEKVNSQKRAWRDNNLEHARKLNLDNQKKHRASANARNRKYAEANRDKLRLKNSAYGKANPHKACAKAARYRAAKLRATPSWADHAAIGMIYRAAEVIRITGFDVHVDHVVPLQGKRVTGLHVHNNLKVIKAEANRSKSNHF